MISVLLSINTLTMNGHCTPFKDIMLTIVATI